MFDSFCGHLWAYRQFNIYSSIIEYFSTKSETINLYLYRDNKGILVLSLIYPSYLVRRLRQGGEARPGSGGGSAAESPVSRSV